MKKLFVFLFLLAVCVACFFNRLHNFNETAIRTMDEEVYSDMARQVLTDVRDYNSIPFAKKYKAAERYVPKYMFQPLYKHPPLFTFSIAASLKLFGHSFYSAAYPPILFGVLLIPLTYLLGRLIFSVPAALLASIYMAVDPVNVITSQKVWMDTQLAFLTVLSIYFFAVGMLRGKDSFYLLSGIAAGLAFNTKYTGLLATIIITLFAVSQNRELFRNKCFLVSLVLPALMIIPWIVWNFQVYGLHILEAQGAHTGVGEALGVIGKKAHLLVLIGLIAWTAYYFVTRNKAATPDDEEEVEEESDDGADPYARAVRLGSYAICGLILYLVGPNVVQSLIPYHVPTDSWAIGHFHGQPTWFYFGRLIEFNLVYVLGILSLFVFEPDRDRGKSLVVIATGVLIVFFIAWRNYQSRYILAALPFLLILSADVLVKIFQWLGARRGSWLWPSLRVLMCVLCYYALYRTMIINFALSYTNNACYY